MKSLRNIFRSKGHKEEKENLDESRHVTFLSPGDRRASKRGKKTQRTFADDTVIMRPSYAYEVPTVASTRKPTRSCPGGPLSPAGSSDDETLVAEKYHKRQPQQSYQRRYQQLDFMAVHTSTSEYDDPSPVASVLHRRHEVSTTEKYWKDKYQMYKDKSRAMKAEVEKLRAKLALAHEEQRKQASVLTDQLRAVTVERDTLKQKLEIQAPPWTRYPFGNFQQPLINDTFAGGAGEHLASHPALPSTHSNNNNQFAPRPSSDAVDEVKNFRMGHESSSMDDSSRTRELSPLSNLSLEQIRGHGFLDDGYNTSGTHDSAKLSIITSEASTPLVLPRRFANPGGSF